MTYRHMPAIKAVMTPFPYSVTPEATLEQAQEFMRGHRIRHLAVARNGQVVGMLSDRDIKLLLGPDFAYPDSREITVEDAMVSPPYVVDLHASLESVLRHMAEQHIGSVAITRKGKLAGIFTVTDACRAFSEFLTGQFGRPGGDDAA